MCGLVGIFDLKGKRDIDQALLKRMNDALIHRGPDGDGLFFEPGLGLGHRRLSIIDLAGGHQPMTTPDRAYTIVFNGEIYNFQEIREDLKKLGHHFTSHSDTEVILEAWRAWGADSIKRLKGMFAFALWDNEKETLTLCRDRLGKKPLYYTELGDGYVAFGSELKALKAHPGTPSALNPQSIEDYFAFGYIPDPKTIYKGVYKLPPAHTLTYQRGKPPILTAYWDLEAKPTHIQNEHDAAEDLIEKLKSATTSRLISDVPLGAFLSGGVDSSAIVAMMAGASSNPVNTFSISFDNKDFDESAYAEEIAARYATAHLTRRLDPNEFSVLDQLASMYDEPFGDSSAMPTYRVCAEARKHVTVCLSGDGGDELFAGYRRYLWHKKESELRQKIPNGFRSAVFGFLGKAYPKLDWAPRFLRAKHTFQELSVDDDVGFFYNISVTPDALRHKMFSDKLHRDLEGYEAHQLISHHMAQINTEDPLLKAQYTDLKTWLAGGILTKVDRASMATSLEVRAPLLDHELAEWALNLPPHLKLNGQMGKYILKRALEPHVPDGILYRPKQGFSMPLQKWFRSDLKQRVSDACSSSRLLETGLFDPTTLMKLASDHQSGRRDHSPVLWLVMMFDSFLKNLDEN